jgi:hypothetical protein
VEGSPLLSHINLGTIPGKEPPLPRRKIVRTRKRKEPHPAATLAGAEAAAEVTKDRRRSERLTARIPVILLGKDAAGREFFDRSEMVSLDSRGGRVRTRFSIRPGTILEVQLTNEKVTKRLRVVWQGDRSSLYEGMIGLEFADPNDTWNLRMLRARWELGL